MRSVSAASHMPCMQDEGFPIQHQRTMAILALVNRSSVNGLEV